MYKGISYLDSTTATHWGVEFKDYKARYKLFVKGTVPKVRSADELKGEAEMVRKLFEEYEEVKMDVKAGDVYYIISAQWLKNWKLYVGFNGMQGGEFPGPISNEDIIEFEEG